MTLRWEDPNDLVQKVTGPPIEAYNYHVECQTLEDLVSFKYPNSFVMFYIGVAKLC
jgi:hypothetical protein